MLYRFEQVATDMMIRLEQSLSVQSCFMEKPFYQTVCDTFFENYFMDDFCNKIMLRNEIEVQDDKTVKVLAFVEKVKRYTEIEELTPTIVNEFIDYIMVSKKQIIDGKTVYPIDIYYNGVGIITAPSAE